VEGSGVWSVVWVRCVYVLWVCGKCVHMTARAAAPAAPAQQAAPAAPQAVNTPPQWWNRSRHRRRLEVGRDRHQLLGQPRRRPALFGCQHCALLLVELRGLWARGCEDLSSKNRNQMENLCSFAVSMPTALTHPNALGPFSTLPRRMPKRQPRTLTPSQLSDASTPSRPPQACTSRSALLAPIPFTPGMLSDSSPCSPYTEREKGSR